MHHHKPSEMASSVLLLFKPACAVESTFMKTSRRRSQQPIQTHLDMSKTLSK